MSNLPPFFSILILSTMKIQLTNIMKGQISGTTIPSMLICFIETKIKKTVIHITPNNFLIF